MSGSSPTATASVREPDRLARERRAQRAEERAVDLVEAELVDLEQRERGPGGVAVDGAVAAHLGVVADPLQQPVGDARRAPGAAGDLGRALRLERDAEDARRRAPGSSSRSAGS